MALLTQKEISGLRPKNSAYYRWDDDRTKGAGRLGIKVFTSGNKTFVFRYYVAGKRVFITLGRFPELSLVDARAKAKEFGLMVSEGRDPKEEQRLEKLAHEREKTEEALKGSIQELFQSYTAQMKKDGKRTYAEVLYSLEKETYPIIPPETKAKDVTTVQLINVLAQMIQRGAATHSNRVRSFLMAAFNHGLSHDNDPANFIGRTKFGLTFNPMSAIPKQRDAEHVGQHYLTLSEVSMLFDDLKHEFKRFNMSNSMRNLLFLCFYTGGQRPYELISSRWESINWQEKTLLITPDLSKNKRAHIIPLTNTALEIFIRQKAESRNSDFIFPHRFGDDHLRTDSLSQTISRYRKTAEIRPFTPRDIRRTCKTLMGELGVSKEIRDRIQNHALNDVSSKHYDRYDYLPEKRRALEAWENRLNGYEIQEHNIINIRG